jgi:hypothetical protein
VSFGAKCARSILPGYDLRPETQWRHLTWQQFKERNMADKKQSAEETIDVTAPAGSENSLGEESVRDGRPASDSSVVEAIDEEGPGIEPIEDVDA